MKTAPRLIIAAVAASFLVTACGALGGGNTTAICQDATKAFTDYSTQATQNAGNLDNFNKANANLSAKLKDLAGQADGDLKTSLTNMANTWASFKIDITNPNSVTEFTNKVTQATTELASACS